MYEIKMLGAVGREQKHCYTPKIVEISRSNVRRSTMATRFTGIFIAVMSIALSVQAIAGGNNTGVSTQSTWLTFSPDSLVFDTTCGVRVCKTVTIKNISPKIIDNIRTDSTLQKPFNINGSIKSKTLGVSESTSVSVCFDATKPLFAQDTLHVFADVRDPFNLAMLFDVSNSMGDPVSNKDKTTRLTAAKSAGNKFLDAIYKSVRTTPDTCAVFSFAGTNTFTVNRDFTTNKQLLSTSIASLILHNGTCLYNGVSLSSKRLAVRKNPVLVVLSDGANNGCGAVDTENSCIQDAINAGVKVYVIGIVDITDRNEQSYISILRNIATKTGGKLYTAVTTAEIDAAYADIIARLGAEEEFIIPMSGKASGANIKITPASIAFDSVKIGDERCATVTVKNMGTAAGNVTPDMLIPANNNFVIANQSELQLGLLQPDSSFSYQVCFRPTRLRTHLWNGSQILNPCYTASQQMLQGVGYDSIVVRMNTDVTAKPSDFLPIPIQLLNAVPQEYGVDSVRFTVAYNSTLLDTATVPVSTYNASANTLSTIRLYSTRFSTDTMFVDYLLKGTSLLQPTPDSTLLNLQYKMLSPSVMQSQLTLTNIQFADGNPKVGIIQPAIVRVDPTCFQDKRLFGTASLRLSPQTSYLVQSQTPTLSIDYTATTLTEATVSLYNLLGKNIQTTTEVFEVGTNTKHLSLHTLTPGSYYVTILHTSGTVLTVPITVY